MYLVYLSIWTSLTLQMALMMKLRSNMEKKGEGMYHKRLTMLRNISWRNEID